MKLLVVDDSAANRRLLEAQLDAEGHSCVEAVNGVQALQLMQDQDFDGVISDILMPEMDGFRLCLELRRQDRFSAIPFVLYTSTYNSPSDRRLAKDVGADAYLTKPSPIGEILQAIVSALGKEPRKPFPAQTLIDESAVLRQYNEALVRKLEEKNNELHLAVEHLNDLNLQLERRVETRTKELEMANRELEAFSYSVAHDLRSPLSAIRGFVGLLEHHRGGEISGQEMGFFQKISANVQRMSSLIDDLLRLAQMSKQDLMFTTLDVRALVQEVIRSLRDEWPNHTIEIEIGDMPECLGDASLMRQVFQNLLGNAFKYSSKASHPRVKIGGERHEEGDVFFVEDNGAGFDMRYADKLFAAFQRLHNRREFEGTGLGLAIVDRIIQRHGGRIWARSVVGEGATFYFSLPRSPAGMTGTPL